MIEVQSLSRYYGSRCAVDQVSFSISAREVVGFLGLNGAGKTTTLKVLAAPLTATSPHVSLPLTRQTRQTRCPHSLTAPTPAPPHRVSGRATG